MVFIKLQPYRQTSVALRKNLKLASKFYIPYRVVKKISPVAYELQLPSESQIHLVFYVSQLKKKLGPNIFPAKDSPLSKPNDQLLCQAGSSGGNPSAGSVDQLSFGGCYLGGLFLPHFSIFKISTLIVNILKGGGKQRNGLSAQLEMNEDEMKRKVNGVGPKSRNKNSFILSFVPQVFSYYAYLKKYGLALYNDTCLASFLSVGKQYQGVDL